MHIAIVVPPISDLNTPYASVPRLAGWLRKLGHTVTPVDLSLELILRVFSKTGLERMFAAVKPERVAFDLEDVYIHRHRYIRIIDDVIAFAQGRDLGLAQQIARGGYLPEGPRFRQEPSSLYHGAFGEWGKGDLARHLIAFMFQDLVSLFSQTISPHFELTKYGESIADSLGSFDKLAEELERPRNVIEDMMLEAAEATIPKEVDLVCLTCPFPGNLFGSLLIGKWLGEHRPNAKRALGGGYPSTELRSLSDPRVFDYIDYVSIDDGEVPLQQMIARIQGEDVPLSKTFVREDNRVIFHPQPPECATTRFGSLPTPDYAGLPMDRYISLLYRRNHVSRLQSEGTWLKLTAAHGCYWKKCTFCDITLPYIGEFDPMSAKELADQMDAMNAQTGLSGFHFTDEAAPPSLLVGLSLELLRRGRAYRFWGNVRFDSYFTADRCRLLAAAGMVAVTGGIEVASDDVLPKIAKGITVPQTVKVLQAFTGANILTHAYLIYGFPGETKQDTINSLEILRQLMSHKLLHSGFFHMFGLTAHAPIAKKPELFGIKIGASKHKGFANYVLDYEPQVGSKPSNSVHHSLQTAIYAYGRGERFDVDVNSWFIDEMPKPTISNTLVAEISAAPNPAGLKGEPRLCWLGGMPNWSRGLLTVACERGDIYATPAPKSLAEDLARCHPANWSDPNPPKLSQFERANWFADLQGRGIILI